MKNIEFKSFSEFKSFLLAELKKAESFKIMCWNEEEDEISLALSFGEKVDSNWRGGTVIEGKVTDELIHFFENMQKPEDSEVYIKLMPFFSLCLDERVYFEHYAGENYIDK